MTKTKIMAIKGNNWFEQFSTFANLLYQFIGKKVEITVKEIEGEEGRLLTLTGEPNEKLKRDS